MRFLRTLITHRSIRQIHAQSAIVCAVVVALFVAIAMPALTRRSDRLALGNAVVAAETRLQRTRAQIDEAGREALRMKAKLESSALEHIVSASLDRRLLDISSTAAEFGLLVDAVEPGSTAKRSDGGGFTSIAISGRGPYPRVVAWLARLREVTPDLTVETADLAAAPEGGCTFRLALNWWNPPVSAPHPIPSVAGGNEP